MVQDSPMFNRITLNRSLLTSRNLITEYNQNMNTQIIIPAYAKNSCKCGQLDHERTNYSKCILNKKNINQLDETTRINLLNDYENAKKSRRITKTRTLEHNELYRQNINNNYNQNYTKKKNQLIDTFRLIARKADFKESDVFGKYVQTNPNLPLYARHILPKREISCGHCNAIMWIEEKTGRTKKTDLFSICCAKGKVKLPDPSILPILIQKLLENSQFMSNIRIYNASFSFLSFKAEADINLSKNNVYTYRIRGNVQHRIGPLCSNDGGQAKCAQIYIYDGNHEELRQRYSSNFNPLILIQIKAMLLDDCNNPFAHKFLHASQLLKHQPHTRLKIEIISDKKKIDVLIIFLQAKK